MPRLIGKRRVPTVNNATGVWGLSDQAKFQRDGIWPLPYNIPLIGTQGSQGFGVGVYPTALPSGISALSGYDDSANANYGNYQTTNGSIMVFVPCFYYRIGHVNSPRYATYGANALDIVGVDTYATESDANTAGYAMHRAFKDGGQDKAGFFIDKYLASKDGTTSCKSIADADPISLTDNSSYNPSNGMTGCTGIHADAVVLGRSRGTGFHCASAFQYSALALLSLAHGQASSNSTYCAWYNATHNFPKGCNSELADVNDGSVTYANSTPGVDTKPKTRATANFAKTTHNGQNCGVADINGSMWQVLLGVTNFGTSGTDTTQHANGDAYVLKSSVAIGDLTGGWNSGNDAWGNTTHLATLYDAVSGLLPWGSDTDWTYFGNDANQVFSGDTSGINWQRTGLGIQKDTNATNAAGTSLFGNDGCYRYNMANLCPPASGTWISAAIAGAFSRIWINHRSTVGIYHGFRCGFYGA